MTTAPYTDPTTPPSGPRDVDELREDRERLFENLARPETTHAFFDRVAENVDWTVEGTHPLAGRFTSKNDYRKATFDRLAPLMREGTHLEVQRLYLDGTTVIAELRTRSTTLDGAPYDNTLCWVCRFDSARPGATIVEVRAYLDSALVTWAVMHNEQWRDTTT